MKQNSHSEKSTRFLPDPDVSHSAHPIAPLPENKPPGTEYRYIFIGGGVSAGYFARTFARSGLAAGELLIISADEIPPYEKPDLIKKFLNNPDHLKDMFTCSPDQTLAWYKSAGINLMLNKKVVEFDPEKKLCTCDDGSQYYAREAVVIGTGCSPARLPVTVAADLDTLESSRMPPKTPKATRESNSVSGLFYVNNCHDAQVLLDFMDSDAKPKSAVVVGASYNGIEMASYLNSRVKTSLISRAKRVLYDTVPEPVSRDYEQHLRDSGIDLVLGDKVADVIASNSKFVAIRTQGGRVIEADICIVAIGRVPNVTPFEGTGLVLPKRGRRAIAVDSSLETQSRGVFAVGDVITLPLHQFNGHGASCGLQTADHARKSAIHVVKSILSKNPEFRAPYDYFPILFSSFLGRTWRMFGDPGAQESITVGDAREKAVSLFVWDGRIVGSFIESGKNSEMVLLEAATRQQSEINTEKARAAKTVQELMETVCEFLQIGDGPGSKASPISVA